jgi:hypothetical protein
LAAGIWSLIVLNRPAVVAAFDAQQAAPRKLQQEGGML